jgi:uncharacterized protein (DUF1778 family)
MVKTEALSFRIAADTKEALIRAAAADERSVSAMVERILRAWLTEKGYLEPAA